MACPKAPREAGMALLIVLLLLLVVTGSSTSFIWFMNQQQTRAGLRHRTAVALSLAEAGIYRATAILEAVAPDGSPGRNWRPTDYSEEVPVGPLRGRFTLALTDDPDGAVVVTSVGEVSGVRRGVRARVRLASPALLAALYGRSYIRLDGPPAATAIMPYRAVTGGRPWTHIAAGQGIWFASTMVSINKSGAPFPQGSGPVDSPLGEEDVSLPVPVHLLLSTDADVLIDRDQQTTGSQPLRAMGMNLEREESRTAAFPDPPEVDRTFYKAEAINNTANADLNKAAGETLSDLDLKQKRDSHYTAVQFETLQRFADTLHHPFRLHGPVYVTGGVTVADQADLSLTDGALITEGSVRLGHGSRVEIIHSRSTRMLPGLIALNNGGLFIGTEAQLRVHGLVYADWLLEVSRGARVEVVGSILGADRTLSFWNAGAAVLIRYDPAVLGTLGPYVPPRGAVVTWIASWEELP